ncbi:MAG: Fic family protein [Candidatus Omnitrophica bacterium]|nr:Fic family protein [Candidatus Omnitrophota bacterium]
MVNHSKYIWEDKRWTDFSWSSDELLSHLGQARQTQGKILARVKALGIPLISQAQAEILTEEVMQTSAIEGETLKRDSVRSSVVRHLGLSEAGLPASDRHIDGLVEILLDSTQNYEKPLTAKRLQSWHGALFPTGYSGLHKIRVGKWRTQAIQVVSGSVGKEKVHYEAPPADRLESEMKNFLNWWKKSKGTMEGFLRAGIAHFWFVTIHPFDDGNGRIARALTDMALAQDEKLQMRFYSLSSQIMEERNTYYDVLEKCSKGKNDFTAWLTWFLDCSNRAMQKSETIIGNVLAKADFWQHHSQTEMNERQRKAINRLLDAGQSQFKGGLTTRKYASMTKTSRATAFREIANLVEKKVLIQDPQSKGRNVHYDLDWS